MGHSISRVRGRVDGSPSVIMVVIINSVVFRVISHFIGRLSILDNMFLF